MQDAVSVDGPPGGRRRQALDIEVQRVRSGRDVPAARLFLLAPASRIMRSANPT